MLGTVGCAVTLSLVASSLSNLEVAATSIPQLIEGLHSKDYWTRTKAIQSLGKLGPDALVAVPDLREAVKREEAENPPGHIRQDTVETLVNMGPGVIPVLIKAAIVDADKLDLTGSGVPESVLSRMGERSVPALCAALDAAAGNQERSLSLLSALAGMRPGEAVAAVPLLVGFLRADNDQVRNSAIVTLGRIGPEAKQAVPALIEKVGDSDEFVRVASVDALGSMGPAAGPATSVLAVALRDESPTVRGKAAAALASIGPGAHQATAELIVALDDAHPGVVGSALDALTSIGPAARDAIPKLMRLREKATSAGYDQLVVRIDKALARINGEQ